MQRHIPGGLTSPETRYLVPVMTNMLEYQTYPSRKAERSRPTQAARPNEVDLPELAYQYTKHVPELCEMTYGTHKHPYLITQKSGRGDRNHMSRPPNR